MIRSDRLKIKNCNSVYKCVSVCLTVCSININDGTMTAAKDIAVSVLDDADIKVNGQPADVSLDFEGGVNVSPEKKSAARR